MHRILLLIPLAAGLAAAQTSTPAPPKPITVVSTTYLVTEVTENGKTVEKLADGSTSSPGALLQFNQVVQNVTNKWAKPTTYTKIALQQRVDPNTVFQSTKCNTNDYKALFSIDKDGQTFAAAPLKRKVKVTENGKEVEKEVEVKPSEYTFVRWQLPDLKPGEKVECTMRVKTK